MRSPFPRQVHGTRPFVDRSIGEDSLGLVYACSGADPQDQNNSSLPSGKEDSPLSDTESIDLLLFPAEPPNITHAGFGKALHGSHNTLSHWPIQTSHVFESPLGPLSAPAHSLPSSLRRASSCETTRPAAQSLSASSSSASSSAPSGSSSAGACSKLLETRSSLPSLKYSRNRRAASNAVAGSWSTSLCSRSFAVTAPSYSLFPVPCKSDSCGIWSRILRISFFAVFIRTPPAVYLRLGRSSPYLA